MVYNIKHHDPYKVQISYKEEEEIINIGYKKPTILCETFFCTYKKMQFRILCSLVSLINKHQDKEST